MAKLRKVQHLRSSVQGKYPILEQVEYGEITVNFYQGDEFLCIRNKGIKGDGSDDAIVSFRTWPYIQKVIEANELVTAAALTTIKESCGFNVNGEYTPSATSKYISGATNVTEALNVLDKSLSKTYTKNEIDSKGYLTEVPSEYITESELNGKNYATVTQVENKQDTLTAGDGINITDNIISCTLDTSLYSVVTTLPTTGEANKIYLIKSEDSGDSNIYIEYGYIENSWEKLGEYKAEIDLTPYLTKSEAYNAFATTATVSNNELVTAAALTALNESCGFNENAEFAPSATSKYISGATNVTEALNVLDKSLSKTYTKNEIDTKGYLTEVPSEYITESEAYNAFATITTVSNNELVTAAAITKLNDVCGFNENAEFVPSATSKYISEATNVTEALNVLDENLSKTYTKNEIDTKGYITKSEAYNAFATTATVSNNELVTAAALTALNESCGFNENAEFAPSTDATYISNTNSVTEALNVLDNSLSQTQLTLSKAIDVLDTKVPRAITIEHGDSRWDTPSYSDKSQLLSDKNVAFLRNNYNFELTLPFQHLTTIYYAKYVSKNYSHTLDEYNYIFLVGEYMVLINATRDAGEITWHPILDRQA